MQDRLNKLFGLLSSSSPRVKYVKRTLYIPFFFAYHFRKAALDEGFRLGDLARIVIMVGLAVRLLRLGEEEQAPGARLNAMIRELQKLTGRGTGVAKRPYPMNRGERGSWVTVWLPESFLTTLGRYAKSWGESRNDMLEPFFRDGLLAFFGVRMRLLRAIVRPERWDWEAHRIENETGGDASSRS